MPACGAPDWSMELRRAHVVMLVDVVVVAPSARRRRIAQRLLQRTILEAQYWRAQYLLAIGIDRKLSSALALAYVCSCFQRRRMRQCACLSRADSRNCARKTFRRMGTAFLSSSCSKKSSMSRKWPAGRNGFGRFIALRLRFNHLNFHLRFVVQKFAAQYRFCTL